jgi:hypothetical protein
MVSAKFLRYIMMNDDAQIILHFVLSGTMLLCGMARMHRRRWCGSSSSSFHRHLCICRTQLLSLFMRCCTLGKSPLLAKRFNSSVSDSYSKVIPQE